MSCKINYFLKLYPHYLVFRLHLKTNVCLLALVKYFPCLVRLNTSFCPMEKYYIIIIIIIIIIILNTNPQKSISFQTARLLGKQVFHQTFGWEISSNRKCAWFTATTSSSCHHTSTGQTYSRFTHQKPVKTRIGNCRHYRW